MPQLKPHRRELFCMKVIEAAKTGKSQAWAYEAAGYQTNGHSSDVCASRLLNYADVQERIAELGAPAVRKTRVSIETLLNELETTIGDARETKQHGVVIQALTLSAKLVGLLREKIEIGGPNAFDQCTSTEEVMDKLLQELEPDVAVALCDEMKAAIEARAASAAISVTSTKRRIDEASAELIKTLT
jgi:hypothetical protein